tara:strand:+ start:1249 stop:1509 length:261 start_codon:yes stop_codon:yes gene_type:complete
MSGPFKMKGYSYPGSSPTKKVDDNLKNVDISGLSEGTLNKMKKETDPKKDPNDYLKIANTLTDTQTIKELEKENPKKKGTYKGPKR